MKTHPCPQCQGPVPQPPSLRSRRVICHSCAHSFEFPVSVPADLRPEKDREEEAGKGSRRKRLAALAALLLLLLLLLLLSGGGGGEGGTRVAEGGTSGEASGGNTPDGEAIPETMGAEAPTPSTASTAAPATHRVDDKTALTTPGMTNAEPEATMAPGSEAASQSTIMLSQSAAGETERGGAGAGRPGPVANASFFGLQSQGSRILYIVDVSSSMNGRDNAIVMKRQLSQSITALPDGVGVCVIFFSDSAFLAGDLPSNGFYFNSQDPSRTSGRLGVPLRWSVLDRQERSRLVNAIQRTPITGGTDWRPPFQLATRIDPSPDTIFFLTDGMVNNPGQLIQVVQRWFASIRGHVPIHSVAFRSPGSVIPFMEQLALISGGSYKVVQ